MVDSVLDKAQDVVKTSGNQDIEKYIQETKEKYESHMNAAKVGFVNVKNPPRVYRPMGILTKILV